MTSDISRQTFDSRKHYSKVVMQQGRVQLDADWNEQQDILQHRSETQARDMIGPSGAWTCGGGFEVTFTPDGSDLVISPGSMYVDGILCELEPEAAVAVQSIKAGSISVKCAEVDNQPFQPDHWVELLDENGQRWTGKNHPSLLKITAVDPDKEKIDKEKQILTLSTDQPNFTLPDAEAHKLKVRPVMTYLTQPNYPQPDPRMAKLPGPGTPDERHFFLAYLDVWRRQITAFDDPSIREVALGGADTAQRSQTLWQVKIAPEGIQTNSDLDNAIKSNESEQKIREFLRILTFTHLRSLANPSASPYTGKLSVHLTPTNGSNSGVYKGENQLYRVEIHEGYDGEASIATFKWARNNASSLVMAKIENDKVTIQGSGQGSLFGVIVGQVVELVTKDTELHALPGHLTEIVQVDDITGQLTLKSPPPKTMEAKNVEQIKLRLWDGSGRIDGQDLTVSEGWIALTALGMASGIEVRFTQDGTYRSGDYWLIPARTATGKIDWPHTTPQPPSGVEHHYARLACLLHTKSLPLVQDCRRHFFPLTANALHILDINWMNDTEGEHKLLHATEKLRIILDGEPDQQCARAMQAAMIVSIETALPGGAARILLISGIFNIVGNVITWHWHEKEKPELIAKFFEGSSDFDSDWLRDRFERLRNLVHRDEFPYYVRVRVTLKGHLIWQTDVNGRRIYLDGQTFGIPGIEKSGHRPKPAERGEPEEERGQHIYLQFPSGTGRPASDFESWFYLKE